ncbi:MAG: S41 family peptidase [Campylobacterota bacterium]|nr:S41 family peptidase [Campylobacterota bacterium]
MFKRQIFPVLFISIFIFNACGSSGTSSSVNDTNESFTLSEKQFLHNLFLTEYLWYDQVASNIDYDMLTTPQSMINELKVMPPDLWSFTMTTEQYEDFANQKTIGFGFGYESETFTIYLVRIDSPAYGNLFRGDTILEVNGIAATPALISEASQSVNMETTFTLLRESQEIDVSLTSREYNFKVSLGKIIQQDNQKIGYLRYDSFTESSVAEFENIFTSFKTEDIDELVIDLRYNGGGSIATTSALIDNISNVYPGERQLYLDWNINYQHNNDSYYFEDALFQDGNELNMKRVFFLVTQSSASASEAIISALIPYLGASNIITIGEDTHGKPVGMAGRVYDDNYYFLINFIVRNAAGDSTSFDGIPVTCLAQDDITHLLGDREESMLKTALSYIQTGVCP